MDTQLFVVDKQFFTAIDLESVYHVMKGNGFILWNMSKIAKPLQKVVYQLWRTAYLPEKLQIC